MTDYKELDMTIHENCIHYPICLVNDYIHNRCGYYFEKPKQGEWISLEKTRCKGQLLPFWRTHECSVCSSTGQGDFNFCPNCGADMRKEGDEK